MNHVTSSIYQETLKLKKKKLVDLTANDFDAFGAKKADAQGVGRRF